MNASMIGDLLSGNFIAVDFETTGLDPQHHEILEIGMARFESGQLVESQGQLVQPESGIPLKITEITGIRPVDCENQPSVRDIWPDFITRISGQALVMHNASFDTGFMKGACRQVFGDDSMVDESCIYDTLLLSRILCPELPSHKLGSLNVLLNLKGKPAHRASDDAVSAGWLMLHLMRCCDKVNPLVFQQLAELSRNSVWGLNKLFEVFRANQTFRQRPIPERFFDNVAGSNQRSARQAQESKPATEKIDAILGSGGELEARLEGFECRGPQLEMAQAIAQAIAREEFFIAEAGTGVGKSLAYLIPFLSNLPLQDAGRFIVATHTKTLQEQLFRKELPLLQEIMGFPFKAVLLKGRANYVCLRRLHALMQQAGERLSEYQIEVLMTLPNWLHETKSGDIEENNAFHKDRNHALWALINAGDGRCLKKKCPFEKQCYLQRVRREARQADVVVINHSLLFANLISNQTILGPVEYLVVDEAHHIEEVASQYLGDALSYSRLAELCQALFHSKPRRHGVLVMVEDLVREAILKQDEEARLIQEIRGLIRKNKKVLEAGYQFFITLEASFLTGKGKAGDARKIRIHDSDELLNPVQRETEILQFALIDMIKAMRDFNNHHDGEAWQTGQTSQHILLELITLLERMVEFHHTLESFQQLNFYETVVWIERQLIHGTKELVIHAVPLEVAEKLANGLYPDVRCGVFTSATLTVNDSFDYLLHRWGFDLLPEERYGTGIFGSPFDYDTQLQFLLTDFMPDPRNRQYAAETARLIQQVVLDSRRNTLVLFTSFQMLKEVRTLIKPAMDNADMLLLAQGVDGSRQVILNQFKENSNAVLLGTSSFWEGVDVPGEALEIVIITKIPFSVPSEPLVEARSELAQRKFGNGFLNYSVPEAIVHFKQGFGRLIRSGRDRGVILMLDPRIASTRYGPLFLQSVPAEARLMQSEESVLDAINDWFF